MKWKLPWAVESFLITLVIFVAIAVVCLLCWGAYAGAIAAFGPEAGGWVLGGAGVFCFFWLMIALDF